VGDPGYSITQREVARVVVARALFGRVSREKSPMIGYVCVEDQVEKDFDRALLKASLRRWRDRLRRDGAHEPLLSFEETKGALAQWT
jgi:hypothetical protein